MIKEAYIVSIYDWSNDLAQTSKDKEAQHFNNGYYRVFVFPVSFHYWQVISEFYAGSCVSFVSFPYYTSGGLPIFFCFKQSNVPLVIRKQKLQLAFLQILANWHIQLFYRRINPSENLGHIFQGQALNKRKNITVLKNCAIITAVTIF